MKHLKVSVPILLIKNEVAKVSITVTYLSSSILKVVARRSSWWGGCLLTLNIVWIIILLNRSIQLVRAKDDG